MNGSAGFDEILGVNMGGARDAPDGNTTEFDPVPLVIAVRLRMLFSRSSRRVIPSGSEADEQAELAQTDCR